MKTFLIFVLSAALLSVACLTRPTETSFKDYTGIFSHWVAHQTDVAGAGR